MPVKFAEGQADIGDDGAAKKVAWPLVVQAASQWLGHSFMPGGAWKQGCGSRFEHGGLQVGGACGVQYPGKGETKIGM